MAGTIAYPRVTPADGIIPGDHAVFVAADPHGMADSLLHTCVRAGLAEPGGRWAAPPRTALVILGDLVGRGPDSAGALAHVARWTEQARARGSRVVHVRGNHEQWLLDTLEGRTEPFERWLGHGGRAALVSLGALAPDERRPSCAEAASRLARLHPGLRARLDATLPYAAWRDLLLVHAALPAGGRPALSSSPDMLGDDGRFLRSAGPADPRYRDFASLRGVVIGHFPHPAPTLLHGGRTLALDTNACGHADAPHALTVAQLPAAGPLSGVRCTTLRSVLARAA